MVWILLVGTLGAQPIPTDWKFVDQNTLAGRSTLTFQSVDLSPSPTLPLHAEEKPPAGSQFGSAGVGLGGRQRLGIAWRPETNTLWFDADGDGRYAASERHTLADKPLAVEIRLTFNQETALPRTLLLRRRGEGLTWAIRGYTTGTVRIGPKTMAAALTDGDADGCFDRPGADRVWLDLDGDGRFDPLTEQFPLGQAITSGTTPVLLVPRPDGLAVTIRERPNETGTLALTLNAQPKAKVVELTGNLVSEFGEMFVVASLDQPLKLPVGKYRVDGLNVAIADADGEVWRYTFAAGIRPPDIVVDLNRETRLPLLDKVRVTMELDAASPGGSFIALANVVAGDLYLRKCWVGTAEPDFGRDIRAEFRLVASRGAILDQGESGFN